MNIAFVVSSFNVGGSSTYILKKAHWLFNSGHAVVIIHGGGNWINELEGLPFPSVFIRQLQKRPELLSQQDLIQTLVYLEHIRLKFNIELVETYPPYAAIFVEMWHTICNVPRIVIALHYQLRNELFRPLIEQWVKDDVLYGIDSQYLTCSNYPPAATPNYLHNHILPIPIELPDIEKAPIIVSVLQTELSIRQGSIIILAVTRLTDMKKYVFRLIDDFIKINSDSLMTLIIVGDGPQKEKLQRHLKKLDLKKSNKQVIFTGFRYDLPKFYAVANVFVGMGTTALEAAAYGTPVILASPNTEYSPGFLVDNPNSIGLQKPDNQTYTFQELLEILVANPGKRDLQKSLVRRLAEENYDLSKIMVQWLTIYNSISKQNLLNEKVPNWEFGPITETNRFRLLLKDRVASFLYPLINWAEKFRKV